MSLYNTAKLKVGEKSQSNDDAKDMLKVFMQKRIQTTMVGAIDSIEKILGFLFKESYDRELTPDEIEMKDLFSKLRSDILDKGNSQIRQLDQDLSKFNVTRKVYHITLPVKG